MWIFWKQCNNEDITTGCLAGSKDLLLVTYLTSLQLVLSASVAALKGLPVLHHSAEMDFFSGPVGSMSSSLIVSNIQNCLRIC